MNKEQLPPNDKIRLEKYLASAFESKNYGVPHVEIPESIQFQGKQYDFDKLLGGGGDGIAFLMKNQESGEVVVVKSNIYNDESENLKSESIGISNESTINEARTHIEATGDGNK